MRRGTRRKRLGQITPQAFGIAPGLLTARAGLHQHSLQTRQQNRFRAQLALQFGLRDRRRIKVFGIGPDLNPGTGAPTAARSGLRLERLHHITAGKNEMMLSALSPHRDLKAAR